MHARSVCAHVRPAAKRRTNRRGLLIYDIKLSLYSFCVLFITTARMKMIKRDLCRFILS